MKKKIIAILLILVLFIANINNLCYADDAPKTVDDTLHQAQKFISPDTSGTIDQGKMKTAIDLIYDLLLGIAIIAALIVGVILGIKFMVGAADEQADIKQKLIVYIAGCVVVFGAFGIWKLVVTIMKSL